MMLSLKGIFYSLIAKAAIICVNHDDLLKETIGGARIIHLWHATQIKSKPNERLSYDNRKFTGIINAQMQRMDLITVSSKNQVDLMSHVLNIDKAKIRITGYPKTDCLIDVPEFDSIKDCFRNDIPFDKKIILYLPTYRNQHFNLEYDLFDKYGFDCDETEDLLKRHNAILLYIPHYFIKVPSKIIKKWGEYDSLYIYEKTGPLFDINLLHPYVDILITDYSSVFTNYSILNKPIVFAKFDYDYFIGSNSAIGFVYDDITPGPKAENWAEVCHYLERFLNSVDDYHDRRIQISKEFHNFQDGKNCERAYREINRLIEG
jgi:CDP-glycerol glycerophosphotransferase